MSRASSRNFKTGAGRQGVLGGSAAVDPHATAKRLSRRLADAMDPAKAPGKVRRFTREEIAALNAKIRGGGQ